jgi:multidrug efflux system membrane fusion protein
MYRGAAEDRPQQSVLSRLAASLKRRWYFVLLALIAIGVLAWFVLRPSQHPAPPVDALGRDAPIAVDAAKAQMGDMQVVLNGLGTVTPLATVTVVTQIPGQLQEIYFQEGQMVKKGDPLALIDPRPYQATLEQAQGTLAHDKALVQNAELDLKRYQKLIAENAIATQQLDTQAALVEQYKSTVITDQATIDAAKLNITYCHIIAPVSGRVGLRQVDRGNYMTTASSSIVVITQLQPISVIFPLPESEVLQVTKPLHAGQTLQAVAFDKGNTVKLATGKLSNIDNQIDTTTGTLKMRAQFDNQDENLFPNQFVNIHLLVDTLHNQTIVPTTSVQRGARGTFVYLVNRDNTVSVRLVKLGVSQGERQAIASGISPGDLVVTDGVDRLRNHAKITLPGAQPPAGAAAAGGRPQAQ